MRLPCGRSTNLSIRGVNYLSAIRQQRENQTAWGKRFKTQDTEATFNNRILGNPLLLEQLFYISTGLVKGGRNGLKLKTSTIF